MPIAEATGLARRRRLPRSAGDGRGPRARASPHRSTRSHAMRDRFGDRISRSTDRAAPTIRGGIISFGFDGIHAHDISQVLDEDAICVRASHHCAKPLMRVLGVPANTRASFYVYNDEADVDALIDGARPRREVLRHLGGQGDTMPGLEDLYREIILDHYRAPRNRGELPVPPAHKAEGFNPLCGDEVVLYLDVDGDTVHRPEDRGPGLLDQPGVHLDDVGGGEGPAGGRGPPAHPCVQGPDVDPRVEARGRGRRRGPPRRPRRACVWATSRRSRAS